MPGRVLLLASYSDHAPADRAIRRSRPVADVHEPRSRRVDPGDLAAEVRQLLARLAGDMEERIAAACAAAGMRPPGGATAGAETRAL